MPNPNHYNNIADPKNLPKPMKRKLYAELRRPPNNWSNGEACAWLDISRSTGNRWAKEFLLTPTDQDVTNFEELPDPKPLDELKPGARRGVDDFLYYCTHYLEDPDDENKCLDAPPFWAEMANIISDGESSKDIITIHPGAGKTTCILAYVCWRVTCERARGNRSFSVIYGSGNEKLASDAIRQVTNWLTSPRLVRAYGRFKPTSDDEQNTWSKRQLVVAGMGKGKSATLSIWSRTSKIRGIRVKLNIWDDIQSQQEGDPESTEEIRKKWDSEIQSRTEPIHKGGKTVVVGSYASPTDLQHELLKRVYTDEAGTEHRVWRQIKFPAHDVSKCGGPGNHGTYPDGCLLFPTRWPYEGEFEVLEQTDSYTWALEYQCQDVPAGDVLLPLDWIEGSHEFPGCLDLDREFWELPDKLSPSAVVIASMDPSPTQWVAVSVWIWDDPYDHLIAFERMHVKSDVDYADLIAKITYNIRQLAPFDTWIIEKTGAHYLHQSQNFKATVPNLGITIRPHDTHAHNKKNKQFGVWSWRDQAKYGRIRLPYAAGPTKAGMSKWVDEHSLYPHMKTDDSVMSSWFYQYHKRTVTPPSRRGVLPEREVPLWIRKRYADQR